MPLLKMSSWCARLKQILQYRIRLSPIFHSLTHLNLIRPQESLNANTATTNTATGTATARPATKVDSRRKAASATQW
ncbi:hypothetical protein MJO28_006607 [Puccinia striiformis f. sp. tritici]|uniref:Uncharacterized protein n=1 Tax=Puccinia striiformis f. sp. tritici TaxID=168172 RepID=A0ACC0EIC5_9BASI|nr:hypothetical protein MJO28_006607 [Puccinia striiformis f. sp. tritici]